MLADGRNLVMAAFLNPYLSAASTNVSRDSGLSWKLGFVVSTCNHF